MTRFHQWFPPALVALSALTVACGQKPAMKGGYIALTGTAKVKPHDDVNRSDTYCRYKITKTPAGAPLKVGDIICITCPSGKSGCDDYTQIEESGGSPTYDVSAMDKGLACTTCPKSDATPAGWTRELQ